MCVLRAQKEEERVEVRRQNEDLQKGTPYGRQTAKARLLGYQYWGYEGGKPH